MLVNDRDEKQGNIIVDNRSCDSVADYGILACAFCRHRQHNQDRTAGQPDNPGTVTDESGEALPGVSVVVKGTTHGTSTDIDGRFSLPYTLKEARIVVSYLGMKRHR